MQRIDWDLMRPQDIEIRPATIQNGKATLLLFQDSRNTMNALDRNFGEFGWKISYKDVAGQIYGCLSIKDPETGEWISKEDTGEKSNISEDKGLSSDILKRCAVRFGYGRELYSAPRIIVDDDNYGNKGYKVSEISYNDNREITHLTVCNRFGNTVYTWNYGERPEIKKTTENTERKPKYDPQFGTAGMSDEEVFKKWCRKKVDEEGEDKDCVKAFFEYWSKPSSKDPSIMGYSTNGFFTYIEEKYSRHKERFNDYRRG